MVDPGRNIHLQLIVIVLNVILSFCFIDFLSFCLKSVCGLEIIEFGYLFEYLKWKIDLQTTTNVSPPELSGRDVIVYVMFYVICVVVIKCLVLFDILRLFSKWRLMNCAWIVGVLIIVFTTIIHELLIFLLNKQMFNVLLRKNKSEKIEIRLRKRLCYTNCI